MQRARAHGVVRDNLRAAPQIPERAATAGRERHERDEAALLRAGAAVECGSVSAFGVFGMRTSKVSTAS